ncbi:MAG: D-inositol-3-phosphate glycosyltransferase [Mycobacterium sp.]|nr:D-inositol-3-phosphate glycosyltransferase [Mycobacterium sp.]
MSSRPLKVLVIDQAKGVWGAQRYLLRLAPLMQELGADLTLAGPRSLELHDAWRQAGFEAVHLDIPTERDIRGPGHRPTMSGIVREGRGGVRVARMIARVVRVGGYDAIWANAHWIHSDASLAGRMCHTPVVLHLHEEATPGVGRWLRTAAVRMATETVAVSEAVAAGLPALVRNRVQVIPNGVDATAMSPQSAGDHDRRRALRTSLGVGDDDIMVLAATRLDPSKRIEDLLAAVRRLGDPRVRLVVAGTTSAYPDYERSVRAQAEALPAGHVHFCGRRDDMAALFLASDVVMHAGMVEGMPLGLLEAQSCGKPVVAYRVAGVPEAVLHASTGLLASPGDSDGLCDALGMLVRDPALRSQMGASARAHVLSHHRIEAQAARNVAVLTEMCGVPRAMAV